jgi:Predicted transcriptional regulators
MAPSITPLGIAALALLIERPMHPYEMYQLLIQRAEDHIVKVRPGSLYHTVDRLKDAGRVRAIGTDREGNRPERTTYEITEEGRLALGERVADMLGTPAKEYPQFPLAIGEAHNLPHATVIDLLRGRMVQLKADREFLRFGIEEVQAKSLDRKHWLDIPYLLAMREAEIRWLDELLNELESGAVTW